MKYKIQLVNADGRLDYIRGLSEQEAHFICERREWEIRDEAGGRWTMDVVEDDSGAEKPEVR